jgi:hypothetical protein
VKRVEKEIEMVSVREVRGLSFSWKLKTECIGIGIKD